MFYIYLFHTSKMEDCHKSCSWDLKHWQLLKTMNQTETPEGKLLQNINFTVVLISG